MRECTSCHQLQPLENFRLVRYQRKDGEAECREHKCNGCRQLALREWKHQNRDRVNAQAKESYHRNRDKHLHKQRAKMAAIYADPLALAQYKEKRSRYRSLRPSYRKTKNTPEKCFRRYQESAYSRQLEFSLPLESFKSNWQGDCWYCGSKLDAVGWDRVDNSVGYVESNVVLCCRPCNMMKSGMELPDFLARCQLIHQKHAG